MAGPPISRAFGRLVAPDARDRRYPMRHLLDRGPIAPRTWPSDVLDQGDTPYCVGYAWAGWLRAAPLRTRTGPSPEAIYRAAQRLDGLPDDEPGSTVRAGCQALRDRIAEYRWAETAEDVARWLSSRGTVVLGTTWYSEMTAPRGGVLRARGRVEGGHAYLAVGVDPARERVRVANSWGRDWAQAGRAWLPYDELAVLLWGAGEACAAVERQQIER